MCAEDKTKIVKIYRYEMPDGGGVNFTLDGVHRQSGIRFPPQDFVYGYTSQKELDKYFKSRGGVPRDCNLIVYEIPENEIMAIGDLGQVIFDKRFVLERLKETT